MLWYLPRLQLLVLTPPSHAERRAVPISPEPPRTFARPRGTISSVLTARPENPRNQIVCKSVKPIASLFERWFSRFSDYWEDPSTAKGFLGGVWQTGLQTVLFVLLLILSDSFGIMELEGSPSPNTAVTWAAMFLGVLLGGGWNYLNYTHERFKKLGRTFTYRIAVIIGVYGLYLLLLAVHWAYGFIFAVANIIAKNPPFTRNGDIQKTVIAVRKLNARA